MLDRRPELYPLFMRLLIAAAFAFLFAMLEDSALASAAIHAWAKRLAMHAQTMADRRRRWPLRCKLSRNLLA